MSGRLWRFLALLCVLAAATLRSSCCPTSCACYSPSEVHCTFRYLSQIPRDIQPAVQRVNLGYNSLSALTVHSFSGLSDLELLMLHSNAIKTVEGHSFRDLTSLQVLKMSYNRVEKLDKDTFRGLDNLVRLHMDHNHISFIHPESFYGLKMLQLINLEGNQLQQLHPDTFVSLRYSRMFRWSSLRTVHLSDNALTNLPATILDGCLKLESLFLGGNPWSCDCRMGWFTQWIQNHPDVLKCKRDRKFVKEQCPVCAFPISSRGGSIAHLGSEGYTCTRPLIHPNLKKRNFTKSDSDYTPVSPKDFVAPIGTLEMNITDQFHNDAAIACVVQRPTGMENVTATFGPNGKDLTALNVILSTSLVCNVDYDNVRQIWNILATYSDSPMRLERVANSERLEFTQGYTYKQVALTTDEVFTEIEAKIKASPEWLTQDSILLQLDRVATTFPSLTIHFSSGVQIDVGRRKDGDNYSWAMIERTNRTKTENLALVGGRAELNCQIFGNPKPTVEWILPDGSKLRAPYRSEDQRIVVTPDGRLTLEPAETSDTGVYHCIATNVQDADVLAFRVTVLPIDIKEEEVHGIKVSHNVGQNLVLDCEFASSPQASIQWILPDHTILDRSNGNRKLHRNGTLVIRSLILRDAGIYRCLAGNFLGAEIVASQVTVLESSNTRDPTYVKETADQFVQIVEDNHAPGSEFLPRMASEESRSITSGRPYTWFQSRFNKILPGRRGSRRNSGKVFNKNNSLTSKPQIKGTNIKTMSRTLHRPSEDDDGASGDGISEDEFILIATTQALGHYPVGKTDLKISEMSKAADSSFAEEILTAASFNNNQTSSTPITASYTSSNYKSSGDSVATKSGYVSHGDGATHVYGRQTNRPSGKVVSFKPSRTEVTEFVFSGDSEDITSTATPLYSFHGPNVTYMEPKSQTIFTAVTTTEEDQEKITFETTQRIKSELLPGSTIISKHQIQIMPPKKAQSGKRRKFHGRRRIVRPSKITDIQSLLDKFKQLSTHKEYNLTLSNTEDKRTDCGDRNRVASEVSTEKCKRTGDQSLVKNRIHTTAASSRVVEKPSIVTDSPSSGKMLTATDLQNLVSEESRDHKTSTLITVVSSRFTKGTDPWDRQLENKEEPKETSKHQNPFTLPTDEEQRTSTSTTRPFKTTISVLSTDQHITHSIPTPLVTREHSKSPETPFDDSSGSSSLKETFSDNIVIPLTTTEIFNFPRLHGLSTTTESMRSSQTLDAPPTMRTELKQDTPLDHSSASQSRTLGKQKPGHRRKGSRKRRPLKKTTTKSPNATVTNITEKPTTTKSTTVASQTDLKGAVLSPLKIPLKESERSSPDLRIERERESKTSSTTSFPEVMTLAIKPTTSYRNPKEIGLHTTVQSEVSTMRQTLETGWRYSTQPNASSSRGKTSRTVTSDTLTGSTTYTSAQFPYSGSSSGNMHPNDLAMYRDISSKPRINGGKAASFTVLSNSDAFLPCDASGNPDPSFTWNRFSSTTGKMLTLKGKMGKFEVLRNGTLLIQGTNIKDQGQYICVAQNKYGSDKLVVTLSVVAYPTRILETKMREIQVLAGKTAQLECRTEGRPVPIVSWILPNRTEVKSPNNEKGRVTVTTRGTLTIQEVTVLDRGHYKCIASNTAGTDTATVHLQVVAAPPVILEEKRQQVKADTGQDLFFPCTTSGDPQPTTHWVLSDGRVVRPRTFSHTKVLMFVNGTLYLRNVEVSESGQYECIATSSTGSERRVVTLSVERTETAPQIIESSHRRIEVVYGGLLLLNCTAVGEPRPQIIWRLPSKALVDKSHRMGSRIKVLENGTLAIESVNEKDAGDFICVARNKAGDDIQLMSVLVSMKPARIEPNVFGNKQVPFGNDLKVDCMADGVPMPEISWGLPDGTLVNSALQADGTEGTDGDQRYILFNNGTLFLNKVGTSEEGDYTCFAENLLGKDKMHVHISVVSAMPHIQHPNLSSAKVKPGGNVRFDCMAIGEPKPKVIWMLPSKDMIAASNERYLVHANGSLDIRNIKLADAGEYVCMARNAAGEDNKSYKLDIDGIPPIINGFKQNRTVTKDTAVKHTRKLIDCRAEGDPSPKITWIMPDNIFLTAPYFGSRINVYTNGTLEIRNVRPSDSAEFICMAQNDGGEAVMLVQLEVTDKLRRPIFKNPFNERVVTGVGRTIVLNCSADGQPTPEIIWTLPNRTRFRSGFEGSRYHLAKDGTFVISNASIEDAGKYRCAAKNKVGYIEKLVVFEVVQKPYILTRPKGIIRGISGEILFLHCLTDGTQSRVSWSTPGGFVIAHPQVSGRYHLMDNGTLVIHQTTMLDHGNYVCRAKNDAGEAVLSVPVIIIAYPPRITIGPPPSLRGVAGVPIDLKCIASGIPTPEITWELPDRTVLPTTGKERPLGNALLHAQGTLIIRNPTKAHSGNYKCTAFNYLGRVTRTTYMTII